MHLMPIDIFQPQTVQENKSTSLLQGLRPSTNTSHRLQKARKGICFLSLKSEAAHCICLIKKCTY